MEDRDLLVKILEALENQARFQKSAFEFQEGASREQTWLLQEIVKLLSPPPFPTAITFQGDDMGLPTVGGNTLVFTGTLSPAGAVYPSDTTFTVTSNDPAVIPTVDATGLIVTIPLPSGWVESTTTPLAIDYAASSVSTSGSLTAVITPSAPPATFPTGITFAQTT